MSDSLNNFIDKAGQSVSEKLSRAVLGKPVDVTGAPNHSGNYVGPGENAGVNRTEGINIKENPNPSPGQVSPATPLSENGKSYPAGFTPVSYYKTESGDYQINISGDKIHSTIEDKFQKNVESYLNFNDSPTSDFKFGLSNEEYSSNWPGDTVPYTRIGEKNDREAFDGSFGSKPWEKNTWWSGGEGTPYENEDPVYFGFEIEIDVLNSPLINGQALEFLNTFGQGNEEIKSRIPILESFIYELSRYFSFNTDKVDNRSVSSLENLFATKLNKKFYVKKVDGLDKLVESNTSNASAAFAKYKTDVLKISFEEDTNLNTGTLVSLYKLLYWSRVRGKNIIPENLLRFDCKIVVSEARNLARIRRAFGTPEPNLEVIRENVSRYVYNIYECQFFFKSMTHPSTVDISTPPTFAAQYEVEISYKFSDMRFERFVFSNNFGAYKSLKNRQDDPLNTNSLDGDGSVITEEGIISFTQDSNPVVISPIIDGYSGFFSRLDSTSTEEDPSDNILENLKDNDLKSRFANAIGDASDKLLVSLKRAALNEAQRQLNNQFRLLNNTLDKVRNSFGIGRMAPPTNVYQGAQPGTFFFDVQNSLRNFAGDTLSGTIFGNNG